MNVNAIKINTEKLGVYLFLFFLMYSNLFSRVTGLNLNAIFYLIFLIVFLYSLKFFVWDSIAIVQIFIALFFSLYIFDFRYCFSANLWSLKDIVIPLLCFLIGSRLPIYKDNVINYLNLIYLPFVAYGVLQAIIFYSGNLSAVLPWDALHIENMTSTGTKNLFQCHLLRFFGVMNAFVEYQLYVVFIVSLLWLNVEVVKNKILFAINFLLAIIFLALSLERSPIAMFLILIFFGNFKFIPKKINLFLLRGVAILAVIIFLIYGTEKLKEHPMLGCAAQRLNNLLTLNLGSDEAIKDRTDINWEESSKLASKNYFGIGPGRVSPSAQSYKGYVGPHNNFLVYWLGYGILGLIFFLFFLFLISVRLYRLERNYKYFGYGTLFSFCAMAMFNSPFLGKGGILFFLILGYLLFSPSNKYGRQVSKESSI